MTERVAAKVTFYEADIRDLEALEKARERPDVVVDVAGKGEAEAVGRRWMWTQVFLGGVERMGRRCG